MNSDFQWHNQAELEQQEQQYLENEASLKADDEAYSRWSEHVIKSGVDL